MLYTQLRWITLVAHVLPQLLAHVLATTSTYTCIKTLKVHIGFTVTITFNSPTLNCQIVHLYIAKNFPLLLKVRLFIYLMWLTTLSLSIQLWIVNSNINFNLLYNINILLRLVTLCTIRICNFIFLFKKVVSSFYNIPIALLYLFSNIIKYR